MWEFLTELAIEGGPIVIIVGIFCVRSYLKEKMGLEKEQMYNKTMSNHLAHETESRDKLTAALTSLTEVVRRCPKK